MLSHHNESHDQVESQTMPTAMLLLMRRPAP